MVRAGTDMSNATFIDVDICNQMEPLQKSYSVTLTHIFVKVKLQIVTKLVQQNCLHLYGTRHRVGLVDKRFYF